MATIQELTAKISQIEDIEERKTLSKELLELIRKQENLWAAFCPSTKHYFLAKEEKQLTAYLFSEEELCQNFVDEMRKRHIILEVFKNQEKHRVILFAELFRCGVTQIVIDSAENYYAVPLNQLISIPDYSKLPLVQRPVLNPTLTGKMLLLTQDIRWERADGNTELDVLQEIYHSPFLHPFSVEEDGKTEKPGIYGDSLFMIFTDLFSLKSANPKEYPQAKIVRFADLHKLLEENPDKAGIIINPGSGAPMLLDMQLLELTQKSAEGDLSEVNVKSMNKDSGKVIVTKPEMLPHDMINYMTDYLKDKHLVKRIWLRTIRKEEEIRRHYLIIIDWAENIDKEQRNKIQKEISEIAMPFARGLHIEYMTHQEEDGKTWTGSSEPFYQEEVSVPAETEKSEETKPKKKGLFGLFSKK